MKTKREIILETVKYYENNDRGIEYGRCVYYSSIGKMCAFGRCLTNPLLHYRVFGNVKSHFLGSLKFEYQGHSHQFWSELQRFHDDERVWQRSPNKRNVLTELGKRTLEFLLDRYKFC